MSTEQYAEHLAALNATAQRGHAVPTQSSDHIITIGDLGTLKNGQFSQIQLVARPGPPTLRAIPENSQDLDTVETFPNQLLAKGESSDIGIKVPFNGNGQMRENQQHVFQQKLQPNTRIPAIIRKGVFSWMNSSSHYRSPPSSPISEYGEDDEDRRELYVIGGWVKGCETCRGRAREFDFRSHLVGSSIVLTMSVNRSPPHSPGSRHSSPKGSRSPSRAASPVSEVYSPMHLGSPTQEVEHDIDQSSCLFLYYYKIRRVELSERNLIGGLESVAGSTLSLQSMESRISVQSRFSIRSNKSRREPASSRAVLPTIHDSQVLESSSTSQPQYNIPWNPVDIVLEYVHKTLLKAGKLLKELKKRPDMEVFAVIFASHFDAEKLWAKWIDKGRSVATMPPLPQLLEEFAPAIDIHTHYDPSPSQPTRIRIYASLCHNPKRDCYDSKHDKEHVTHLENNSSNAFSRLFSR